MSKDKLLEKLKSQGVVNLFKLEKTTNLLVTGRKFYTGSIILFFDNFNNTKSIIIEFLKINLNLMNPRPMMYNNCGMIGKEDVN